MGNFADMLAAFMLRLPVLLLPEVVQGLEVARLEGGDWEGGLPPKGLKMEKPVGDAVGADPADELGEF